VGNGDISGFTLDGNNDAKSTAPLCLPATAFRSQQLTFFNSNGTIEDNALIAWQDPPPSVRREWPRSSAGSSTPVTVNVRTNVVSATKDGHACVRTAAVVHHHRRDTS